MPATLDNKTELKTPAARRSRGRWFFCLRLALVGVVAWQLYVTFVGSNFHTVIPGEIYRGAQLSPSQLERAVDQYNIRTVLNLRGLCNPQPWYVQQNRVVQRLGIMQEDVCFSAGRLPSQSELRRLVEVFDRSERPIYVHCRRGADRTGLACAVVKLLQDTSYEEGRGQLHWRFGHFALGRTAKIDDFFDLYENWLAETSRKHSGSTFRHWILYEYRGGWMRHEVESFEPLQAEIRTNEPSGFRVRLRNAGPKPWNFQPQSQAGHHLGFTVFDDKDDPIHLGKAGMLRRRVEPGESIDITLVVPPLKKPGRYRILADLREEHHCWFQQTGSEPLEEEIVVRD